VGYGRVVEVEVEVGWRVEDEVWIAQGRRQVIKRVLV
jgi:hypothetical protein